LRRALRGDLDCVVGKCLEKDRSRRYESCAAVAADLQAYLEHRPISVAPPGRFYLARKFVRRNKLAVTAASVVLLTLVVGTIVSATLAIRAVRAERSTKAANENLRAVNDFLQHDLLIQAGTEFQNREGFKPDKNLTVKVSYDEGTTWVSAAAEWIRPSPPGRDVVGPTGKRFSLDRPELHANLLHNRPAVGFSELVEVLLHF
jgi:hypothetical protein